MHCNLSKTPKPVNVLNTKEQKFTITCYYYRIEFR